MTINKKYQLTDDKNIILLDLPILTEQFEYFLSEGDKVLKIKKSDDLGLEWRFKIFPASQLKSQLETTRYRDYIEIKEYWPFENIKVPKGLSFYCKHCIKETCAMCSIRITNNNLWDFNITRCLSVITYVFRHDCLKCDKNLQIDILSNILHDNNMQNLRIRELCTVCSPDESAAQETGKYINIPGIYYHNKFIDWDIVTNQKENFIKFLKTAENVFDDYEKDTHQICKNRDALEKFRNMNEKRFGCDLESRLKKEIIDGDEYEIKTFCEAEETNDIFEYLEYNEYAWDPEEQIFDYIIDGIKMENNSQVNHYLDALLERNTQMETLRKHLDPFIQKNDGFKEYTTRKIKEYEKFLNKK